MKTEDQLEISTRVINIRLNAADLIAEKAVDMLETVGGDLDEFANLFDPQQRKIAIFTIEKSLLDHEDSSLKERWDKAIELFHTTRMRMLQRKAVRLLEQIDNNEDKQARVDLAFAKLVLGDLLAANTATAKNKALNKDERSSNLANIKSDMQEDDDA